MTNNIDQKTANTFHGHVTNNKNVSSKKKDMIETSSDSNSNNGINTAKVANKNNGSSDNDDKDEMIRRAMEF